MRDKVESIWEKIKEVYAGGFAILALTWVLIHLILIQIKGVVAIAEPNSIILWIEIIITALLVGLSIERFIKDWYDL